VLDDYGRSYRMVISSILFFFFVWGWGVVIEYHNSF